MVEGSRDAGRPESLRRIDAGFLDLALQAQLGRGDRRQVRGELAAEGEAVDPTQPVVMVPLVAVADENAAERQPREVELGADDQFEALRVAVDAEIIDARTIIALVVDGPHERLRSEEHTSELQSLMRISYAVFCLKKKKNTKNRTS